jgi:hypothetical protein
MENLWGTSALHDLDCLPVVLANQVRKEVETLFADGAPEGAIVATGSTEVVELPCGVEVFFRKPGGKVKIFAVTDPLA